MAVSHATVTFMLTSRSGLALNFLGVQRVGVSTRLLSA
jgi:hypothetical protein